MSLDFQNVSHTIYKVYNDKPAIPEKQKATQFEKKSKQKAYNIKPKKTTNPLINEYIKSNAVS